MINTMMNMEQASEYLTTRYNLVDGEIRETHLLKIRFLFRMYQRYSKEWDASTASMLEIGGGPSLINCIVAAPYFSNLVFSEYDSGLRAKIVEWKEEKPEMFDWSAYFNFVYAELAHGYESSRGGQTTGIVEKKAYSYHSGRLLEG